MLSSLAGVLFDGFAYGMLLFLLSVGLSVTLGMMNFVNLAHCSFAMVGGYATVTLVNKAGWPFLATLPAAFLVAALLSIPLERIFFRRLYRASDLDQCLLTIGLVFISVAAFAWFYTSDQQSAPLPSFLQGSIQAGAEREGDRERAIDVDAEAARHALVVDRGAHLRAEAGVFERGDEQQRDRERDADEEQPVDAEGEPEDRHRAAQV